MLQRIQALLAITQLTNLHSCLQIATQQLVSQASYNQHSQGAVFDGSKPPMYGQPTPPVFDSNNQLLTKELMSYVTLPSTTMSQGRTLGIEDEDKVNWSEVGQHLIDQAFPQTETSQLIDLTNKVLTIANRYAPATYHLVGLKHIHWDKALGNSLPFTFTVTDLPDQGQKA